VTAGVDLLITASRRPENSAQVVVGYGVVESVFVESVFASGGWPVEGKSTLKLLKATALCHTQGVRRQI
jgi:hypothetical protein